MDNFPNIEEVHNMLDEIAEEIPSEFFKDLNEGVVLLPQYKVHPESMGSKVLYIMGEYSISITGRNIKMYYGSFKRVHRNRTREYIYNELKETLVHEFTHHLESLAGEKGLEIKDKEALKKYGKEKRKRRIIISIYTFSLVSNPNSLLWTYQVRVPGPPRLHILLLQKFHRCGFRGNLRSFSIYHCI